MTPVNALEIEKTLRLLVHEGATFEVRALGNDRGREVTLSGYFTDPAAATKAIIQSCSNMIGVYATLNPVRPELIARCANRIAIAKKGNTTSDHHVLRRARLLIDIDGVPVAGISASDEEHRAAIDLAGEIEHELVDRGWTLPLRGDSGNGAHLDYAIDLPADDGGLVERFLAAAQARWGCSSGNVKLKIDTSNKNPARITKIFGTPARKGDNLPERPHRISKIISAPDRLDVVTREQLESFVIEFGTAHEQRNRSNGTRTNGVHKTLDVQAWLEKYAIDVKTTSAWQGGTMYELAVCPANQDHNRGEAHVEQHASGAISAGCHHESCKWDWAWLREQREPRQSTSQSRDEVAEQRERKQRKKVIYEHTNGVTQHAGIGPKGGFRLTDLGNARRLANANANRLRFVQAWNKWLIWDGKRWHKDELGAEQLAAKQVVASIYAEAASCANSAAIAVNAGESTTTDEGFVDELMKHARDSAKRSRIDAMVSLASTEPEIAASSRLWDSDAWLLNVANGTIDLRSGELQPHRQSDMITMLAPVDYDPEALAPRWLQFLERVQPDAEIRSWIQRYLGYSITGDVREQCLAFFYGDGSNGKSVLLDVVLDLLGGYGLRAAPDLVLAKHGEAHPTELADLEGRRLVVCSEIEQGRTWAEALIKRITGDRTITARRMRQDFYTFPTTHKLVVAANTRPIVRGTDHGIWRRMRLVPWSVKIPDSDQDKTLPQQLVDQEASGILAWLVRGCIAWQNAELGSAKAIDKATKDYRADQDIIGRWIEDRCEHGSWQATTSLYFSFVEWCKEEGMQAWTRRTWRERMLERDGITEERKEHGKVRALCGIQLRGVR